VPNGEFGKCEFLNDVPIEELKSALKTHKEFIKSRFGSGDGKEAYVDAGDLGVDPKKYANGNGNSNGDSAGSLKTNGLDKTEKAAVKAGGVPVNGHVVNGVSHLFYY
jgi:3-dehydroquinate synthase